MRVNMFCLMSACCDFERSWLQFDQQATAVRTPFPIHRVGALGTPAEMQQKFLDQGVQIVYGGKAHPRDTAGQAIVARVLRWARDRRFRDRIILIPNYEADFGRLMTQGCDVWLNNPRRPREASGTSGQKAAMNGNPNCSVLDGWWPEAFDGRNGWAIGTIRDWTDTDAQDAADLESLYSVLEQEIVPMFAQPSRWAACMAHTITVSQVTRCPIATSTVTQYVSSVL